MKRVCIPLFILLFLALFFTPAARYKVIGAAKAQSTPISQNLAPVKVSGEAHILLEAHKLATTYGIRPYWSKTPLSRGEIPPANEVDDIIAHLMPCENLGPTPSRNRGQIS